MQRARPQVVAHLLRFTEHHAFLLTQMLHQVDAITADIATVQARIEAQLGELAPAVARLDAIAMIRPVAAQMMLAEIGLDMTRFPTPAHLTSWAGSHRGQRVCRAQEGQGRQRERQPLPGPGAR